MPRVLTPHLFTSRLAAVVLVLAGLLCAVPEARAQQQPETRFSGLGFLQLQSLARPAALGGATVAMRGYAAAAAFNPATIGPEEDGVLVATDAFGGPVYASEWFANDDLPSRNVWTTAPSVSLRYGPWAAAFTYRRFDFGTSEVRTPDNQFAGTAPVYDQAFTLSLAYAATEQVRVGVGLSRLRGVVLGDQVDAGSVALDLGVHYETTRTLDRVTLRPSFGLALRHFGPTLEYDDGFEEGLPTMLEAGFGLDLAATQATWHARPAVRGRLYGALSKQLAGTDENGDPFGPFAALVNTWDAVPVLSGRPEDSGETVSAWAQIGKHVGLEAAVFDLVALRAGYQRGGDPFAVRNALTFGAGLDLYYLAVDYGVVSGTGTDNFSDLSQGYWRVTARVPFGPSPRNFWPALLGR